MKTQKETMSQHHDVVVAVHSSSIIVQEATD